MKSIPFALILSVLAGFALLAGCSKPAALSAAASDIDYYTCTMHPSVHSHDPDGKCPICGMDLVPVKKAAAQVAASEGNPATGPAGDEPPHEFTIAPERQQLIGVTYATVEMRPLHRLLRAVGTVAATTARHWDYVARVDGYVHDLAVGAPGDRVQRGQILMDLYSPDLVATENEFVDLLRMRADGRERRESRPPWRPPGACWRGPAPAWSSGISRPGRSTTWRRPARSANT